MEESVRRWQGRHEVGHDVSLEFSSPYVMVDVGPFRDSSPEMERTTAAQRLLWNRLPWLAVQDGQWLLDIAGLAQEVPPDWTGFSTEGRVGPEGSPLRVGLYNGFEWAYYVRLKFRIPAAASGGETGSAPGARLGSCAA